MKRLFITAMMLLAVGSVTAQKGRQYDDDIYGGKPAPQTRAKEPAPQAEQGAKAEEAPTYSSSGSDMGSADHSTARQYSSDEYYESEDNDYYYSSRINRFNHPFYDRPYWSTFNNPYWYDPFWVDPYWGWSPWTSGPGVSISIGAGPYWSSYWGWSSWYGNPYFGSYYGYPSYGYGGYYSGYWNGYYAGLYSNNDNHYRNPRISTYGPRYTLRPVSANAGFGRSGGYNGFREMPGRNSAGATSAEGGSVRGGGFRPAQSGGGSAAGTDRNQTAPGRMIEFGATRAEDRPVRNGWNEPASDRSNNNTGATQQTQRPRENRGSWFGRSDRAEAPARAATTPQAQESGTRQQAPRSEQQHNAESAPARGGFNRGGGGGSSGGSRSSGGGFGGGGGGRRR